MIAVSRKKGGSKKIRTYTSPENFWWGSAANGPQTEGRVSDDGKGDGIWDHWYELEPERFFNRVGPEKTSQVYIKYKEDVQLMKEAGHNIFRTPIRWSHLIPEETGKINQKAVSFYRDYFTELLNSGIEPFVDLYHFDMPLSLRERGGWLSREMVDAYVPYAAACFELFGDLVKRWFTHNEPIVLVEGDYLYQFYCPNHINMKEVVQVGYRENLASAKVIKAYHEGGHDGEIGIILNLTPSYPRDETNPEDVKAAKTAGAFFNRSFLDSVVRGEFPRELAEIVKGLAIMPEIHEGDLEPIRENTVNLLVINYYQPRRIKAKGTPVDHERNPMPDDYFDNYGMPNKRMDPYRGWEIYGRGVYGILANTRKNYGNIKCYTSENGMGVEGEERSISDEGIIEDDYQVEFVTDYLRYVHQVIQEGTNCVGHHMWTCVDNWSWTNAYKNRYDFITVDSTQDNKRTIKGLGRWFRTVPKKNGFDT